MWTKSHYWEREFFTILSLYFKVSAKKYHAVKPLCFFAPFPVSAWPLRQFDLKNHENVWTDLKKTIAGRIPETTGSDNPLKRHRTIRQTTDKNYLH